MVSERALTSEQLKIGDVVTVATKMRDRKKPGEFWWWKRFCVVTRLPKRATPHVELTRLQVDMSEPDTRFVDLETEAVYAVPNDQWPQGVSAMYAKALAKGWVKLDLT